MKDIGMGYEAIDACPNDHIIYYGQHATKMECTKCGVSIYQTDQVANRFLKRFFVTFS